MVDTTDIKNKKENSNNKSAVYPFKLDVPAFPERKYIAGIAAIIKYIYISVLISILLVSFSVFRANNRKVYPQFITYDIKENTFKFIPSSFDNKGNKNTLNLNERYYIEESFLKNYLKKRFEITKDFGTNYNNWCNCKDDKIGDKQNNKLSKSGIFDLNGKCYLCNVMKDNVYRNFYDFDYTYSYSLMNNGGTRNVEILDIKQINFFETVPQKSFLTKMLDKYILSKNNVTTTTAMYKIVFILQEQENDRKQEESFIGFITINGIKFVDEIKKITAESYSFHPLEPEKLRKLYD